MDLNLWDAHPSNKCFLVTWSFRKCFNSNNWDGRCVVIIWIHLTNAVISMRLAQCPKQWANKYSSTIVSCLPRPPERFLLSPGGPVVNYWRHWSSTLPQISFKNSLCWIHHCALCKNAGEARAFLIKLVCNIRQLCIQMGFFSNLVVFLIITGKNILILKVTEAILPELNNLN